MVANLIESCLAQAGLFHGDEPLVGGAEDDRLMATPAMRVAVVDIDVSDERSLLFEPLDDLRIGLIGVKASEQGHVVGETTVVVDRHDGLDAELLSHQVVVHAVAGSGMDRASAGVEGDVVAPDDASDVVLDDRAHIRDAAELITVHENGLAVGFDHAIVLPTGNLGNLLHHFMGKQHELTVGFDEAVFDFGTEGYSRIRRKRPGRGGPDQDIRVIRIDARGNERLGDFVELEVHIDRRRHLVGILDLGLGQGGVAMFAPVNGLAATIDSAVEIHLLEDFDVGGLKAGLERQIRMLPIAVDAKALEPLALNIDEALGPFATEFAHFGLRKFFHFLGAELLFHLVLDRLAMAVPARDVRGEITALGMRFDNEVLEDLVESMADVNRSVRIRRAVMQDERLAIFVLLQNTVIDILLDPLLQALRLVLGQIRAHGEIRLGQVHRVLVIVSHRVLRSFHSNRTGTTARRIARNLSIIGKIVTFHAMYSIKFRTTPSTKSILFPILADCMPQDETRLNPRCAAGDEEQSVKAHSTQCRPRDNRRRTHGLPHCDRLRQQSRRRDD